MKKICLYASCVLLTSCGIKVGPTNLKNDSLAYNRAVQNSVDTQLLLNIVRLRYRDTPTFLQVGLVSSSYDFKRSASAEIKFFEAHSGSSPNERTYTPRMAMDYSEKPTTTYQPLRGEHFVKEMLSPISIETIVLLHTSGWNIDRILRCCVQRMNVLQNAPSASGPTPENSPNVKDFLELTKLFRDLEYNDAIRIVTQRDAKSKKISVVMTIDEDNADRVVVRRIWQVLELAEGSYNILLTPYHGKQHRRNEIMVDCRSPLSLLYFLSQGVHVPSRDECRGKVTVTCDSYGNRFDWDEVLGNIMDIRYGRRESFDPAVVVKHRGLSFYIDDSDLESKSTFSMLAQLLTLQTGRPDIPTPVFTIPLSD